jgi:hypothetical protein
MEALLRVKLSGFDMVIAELGVELDLLRPATRYQFSAQRQQSPPL